MRQGVHAFNIDEQAELRVVERLKVATITLRDASVAQQRAAKEYQEALQAFNRHVAPETP